MSCSKDDSGIDEPIINYIGITANYDTDIIGTEGRVMVFDLTTNFIDELRFSHAYLYDKDYQTFWMYDVNDEYVFPFISEALKASKDPDTGLYINQSKFAFFSDELPYSIQNDEPRKILILIHISTTENYAYTYKVIDWKQEKIDLTKTFKSNYDTYGLHYEEW